MTVETIMILLHLMARIVLVGGAAISLWWLFEDMRWAQRIGLGLIGGGSLMMIPVIIDYYSVRSGTPYDHWAGTLAAIGTMLFLIGTGLRIVRHKVANARQRRWAARYRRERGG